MTREEFLDKGRELRSQIDKLEEVRGRLSQLELRKCTQAIENLHANLMVQFEKAREKDVRLQAGGWNWRNKPTPPNRWNNWRSGTGEMSRCSGIHSPLSLIHPCPSLTLVPPSLTLAPTFDRLLQSPEVQGTKKCLKGGWSNFDQNENPS